jgi:glycerophosphoryl diester phosphodiesterase
VRKFLPDAKVGFTFKTAGDNVEAQFEKIVKDGFDVNMSINVVTKEWVDRFHAAGLEVTCYTIDDPTVAESLVEMGVNYILTNKLE